jgi:adenosylcobinamide kinase/adenosylcobinamide-phosphate guanylyltransferase
MQTGAGRRAQGAGIVSKEGYHSVINVTFILGGCRSGKSGFALQTASAIPADRRVFIATSMPLDDEMKARVARHRTERGAGWTTVEAPLALAEAIAENARNGCVILVDCLTLWISNMLLETGAPAAVEARIPHLIRTLAQTACPVVLVSNEVGAGIVPENKLARQFRDLAGTANQAVAAAAHRVVWVVAGIPVTIKPT